MKRNPLFLVISEAKPTTQVHFWDIFLGLVANGKSFGHANSFIPCPDDRCATALALVV
jgi:hypothetical protein